MAYYDNYAAAGAPLAAGHYAAAAAPLAAGHYAAAAPLAASHPYYDVAPAAPGASAAQLSAPLSTAQFSYNGVAKAKTEAAAAKAAALNAAAAADAANRAAAQAAARAKALSELAEAKDAKLQKDLDETHFSHARIARQTTYPCLGH